ncbi:MAG TPA: hypothetical protein VF503_17230 [Sphingobium sp.]|uniref:hypothetical protein n=1 Tax=Sphingobium sp. TaxID=1912891 RepID=UPI002ECFC1C9
MLRPLRTLTAKLIDKSRTFLEALAGLDDPRGDYLLSLEARIRHIEAQHRDAVASSAAQSATPRDPRRRIKT